MEWFYDIVRFMWHDDNMYITIAILAFIIGALHATNRGE